MAIHGSFVLYLVLQFVTELDILVGSVIKEPVTGHDWGLQKGHELKKLVLDVSKIPPSHL